MADKKYSALISIGGAVASSLLTSVGAAQNKLKALGGELGDLKKRQKELNDAMRGQSGTSLDNLKREYDKVGAAIDRTKGKLDRLRRAQDTVAKGKAIMGKGSMMIGAATAAAATLGVPVMQAAEFETAMMGVAKQVEGARDENGKLTATYYNMRQQIQQLGREIPIATNDIADMVAAGARMGVARDELIGFTKTSAMMSAAFELPAGELADQMGKIAGLYKIPIKNIGRLADTINYLDDNAISKGGDIINFLTRTGGVAGSVKITGQQMAALGSTLLTMGEGAETAATATSAMFLRLGAADKQGKKFQQSIALLRQYDKTLNSKNIARGMQTNAQGTIIKLMQAINKLPSTKRLGVLTDLFGVEHAKTVAKLVTGVEEYRKQIEWATSDASAGSMAKEFDVLMKTTQAQWQITKNTMTELSVNIGAVLLPTINNLMGAVRDITGGLATFAAKHPVVMGVVTDFATVLIGAVAVLGGAKIAIGAVTMAMGVFNTVMMANPIVAVVAAVVALGFAIYEVYKNWDTIKAYMSETWDKMKAAVGGVVDSLKRKWEEFKQWFMSLWDNIVATVTEKMKPVLNVVTMPSRMLGKAAGAVGGAYDWVKNKITGDSTREAIAATAGTGIPNIPAPRGSNVNQTNNTTFNITQQPGQSSDELAEAIERKLAARQRTRAGGLLYDATGY